MNTQIYSNCAIPPQNASKLLRSCPKRRRRLNGEKQLQD
jgi:hypothetical protein